jgi:hypothetical protein
MNPSDLLGGQPIQETAPSVREIPQSSRRALCCCSSTRSLSAPPATSSLPRGAPPLTEAAKANIAEGERARATFDQKAAHCFTSLAGRFLQRPVPAGWMDRISASGEPMAQFIPASTLYHLFCAISEAARVTKAT